MRKNISGISLAIFFAGVAGIMIYHAKGDDETPRMKCVKICQENRVACMDSAGSDKSKKSACVKGLQECLKSCPTNP